MSGPPFSRFWGDPAEHLDEWRALQKKVAAAEKRAKDLELKRNKQRIRKLLKQAKARELKGQR